jgi:hypothetical protein
VSDFGVGLALKSADQTLRAPHARPLSALERSLLIDFEGICHNSRTADLFPDRNLGK